LLSRIAPDENVRAWSGSVRKDIDSMDAEKAKRYARQARDLRKRLTAKYSTCKVCKGLAEEFKSKAGHLK
jgi:hypothetical protein